MGLTARNDFLQKERGDLYQTKGFRHLSVA